ncbi:GntR family transcriptional regulator [Telmatospirillum siberiense]|nr:GntR family transcriptional regulator [Telmatospirillum siberiense]
MTRPQPIRRATLHDETVSRLRAMILEGELSPGMRIPEGQLCDSLGISRTPLREALKVLASEGLIELRPNRGSVVAAIDPEMVAAMFEVIESLDALVGALVCARATDKDLKTLDALHRALAMQHAANDRAGYFESNQRLHRALVQSCGNPVLISLYEGLQTKILRARYMANSDLARWAESLAEHELLNEALQKRAADRVPQLLRAHTHATGLAVIEALTAMTNGEAEN